MAGGVDVVGNWLSGFWGNLYSLWEGRGFPGEAPNLSTLRIILKEPSFWIMMGFSVWGLVQVLECTRCCLYIWSQKRNGPYLGQYLRCLFTDFTLGSSILVGWITDRIGPQKTLMGVFMATGSSPSCWGLSLDPDYSHCLSSIHPCHFFFSRQGLQRSLRLVPTGLKMSRFLSPFRLGFFSEVVSLPLDRGDGRDGIFFTRLHPS